MKEGYIEGYFLAYGLIHAIGGHSDATGCVRWYPSTICRQWSAHGRHVKTDASLVVTCLMCAPHAREP